MDAIESLGFRIQNDPAQARINELISSGEVEVIDPDILRLPNGVIDFRKGDQYRVELDRETGVYQRVWPSYDSFIVDTARAITDDRNKRRNQRRNK